MTDRAVSIARIAAADARSWPLYTTASSRAIERAAQSALPPHTLMHRAGQAVARLALALQPHLQKVWVAAGPGNNGGDGLIAAAWLRQAGKQVHVALLGDASRLPADAQDALARARAAGVQITADPSPPADCDVAIDALLGLGSRRAPEGAIAMAVRHLNDSTALKLAVDLPTGLDAEHGQPFGAAIVRADHTLSLLTLKPGLFTGAGRDFAGQVWFDALGIEAATPADAWLAGADDAARWRQPRVASAHKGSFGDVLVIGGDRGMTGAVWLAATAALCAGAGRVYVDPLAGDQPNAPRLELMCRPGIGRDPQSLARCTVVCGCGGGAAVRDVLPMVLEHAPRLVLDADALNGAAEDDELQALLSAREGRGLATLLTPHPLEAARLLKTTAAVIQADRVAAAQQLAGRFACAVLLKGSGTVCAAPNSTPAIVPTGNALLATAGTGDVLAGWIGGWWASGPAPAALATASACDHARAAGLAGAWWHGRAADQAAAAGQLAPLVASRLIEQMAALR